MRKVGMAGLSDTTGTGHGDGSFVPLRERDAKTVPMSRPLAGYAMASAVNSNEFLNFPLDKWGQLRDVMAVAV